MIPSPFTPEHGVYGELALLKIRIEELEKDLAEALRRNAALVSAGVRAKSKQVET